MKTAMSKRIRMVALATATALALLACGGGDSTPPSWPPLVVSDDGTSNFDRATLAATLAGLPLEPLSAWEVDALRYLREEEKLAHDVYGAMDVLWAVRLRVFANISASEATHTEAVRQLLVRYNQPDPAAGALAGAFANATLQQLYQTLVAQGTPTLEAGLRVGALIEELDIVDIQSALTGVDNQDITLVFESLMKGSRNHLRAFARTLAQLGATYTPVYLSQAAYDAIVNSPTER